MHFLIDAQLPPGLVERLRHAGHEAEHVHVIGLGEATDQQIWTYARRHTAVLVTKDQDFAELARSGRATTAVIWIRLGNTTNRALWAVFEPALPEIIEAVAAGETLIEIV